MPESDLLERLRTELPRLLREHPEVRHELWGLMLEAFPSRQEFQELLQEVRASREDSNRRFEAMDRRFEAMDRRFEAMDRRFEELRADMNARFEAMDRRFERLQAEMREQRLHLSALGGRVGFGLEHVVRGIVEEFAGHPMPSAERLRLTDEAGEVFGIPGAEVEFDLYAHNGTAYLVEVKSHVKPEDVLRFHQKALFAERRLGRAVTRLLVALSMEPRAEALLQQFHIRYRIRAVVSRDE